MEDPAVESMALGRTVEWNWISLGLRSDALDEEDRAFREDNGDGDASDDPLASWWAVLRRLVFDAYGIYASTLVLFLTQAITLAFVGHRLGTLLQAAFAIALSVFNVMGMSVCVGFQGCMDTLCPQAFGRDPSGAELTVVVHRGVLLALLLTTPIIGLFFAAEPALLLIFGHEVGVPAAAYLRAMPLYLVSNTLGGGVKRGLQACQKNRLTLWSSIAVLASCPFLNHMLITPENGVLGAAAATTLANMVGTAVVLGLAAFHPQSKLGHLPGSATAHRRAGYSDIDLRGADVEMQNRVATAADASEASPPASPVTPDTAPAPPEAGCCTAYFSEVFDRKGVTTLLRVAFPAFVAVCSEWWAFEALLLSVSRIGPTVASAFSTTFSLLVILMALPTSLAVASGARIGNKLGEGRPVAARTWCRVAFTVAAAAATLNTTVLLGLSERLFALYTKDRHVINTCAFALSAIVALHGVECVHAASRSSFRAVGEQKMAARVMVGSLWVVGLPLAFFWSREAAGSPRERFAGAIMGFALGLFTAVTVSVTLLLRWDWAAKAAAASAKKKQSARASPA